MITWLHSFSNFSLVLSLLVVGLLITVIIPVYVRKFFKLEPNEHMGQGAEEAFKIIVSIVLLLIAFSLVQTQGDHQNADALVAKESALIIKLHRALDAYGDEAKSQQAELVAYAKSIANDEWPALATGKRSAATTTALVKLGQDARKLSPSSPSQQLLRSEIVSTTTQLNDVREARISSASAQLPTYLYQAIALALIFLVVFAWFLTPLFKMVMYVGGVTVGVALLLALLFSLEGLYSGENAVSVKVPPLVAAR